MGRAEMGSGRGVKTIKRKVIVFRFSLRFEKMYIRRKRSDFGRFWVFRLGDLAVFWPPGPDPDRVRVGGGGSKTDDFVLPSGSNELNCVENGAEQVRPSLGVPPGGLSRFSAAGTRTRSGSGAQKWQFHFIFRAGSNEPIFLEKGAI